MPGLSIDLSIYPNEERLLAALRSGEEAACTCLVKQFANLLYQPALEIVADPDKAEQIVQNAFIKACDKIETFQEQSKLGTWLYRIAVNEALMERRRGRSSRDVSADHEALEMLEQSSASAGNVPVADPLDDVLYQEFHRRLVDALEQLPDTLRSVVILRTLQGYSTEETARKLSISPGTVKVRLHRARERLRTLLALDG